ncbi:MAG: PRC-barrel domain-containing protein [Anaerolineae bacterium]|nr:PRC-barrel domain-containing protein [Anaerolineae bacterium]
MNTTMKTTTNVRVLSASTLMHTGVVNPKGESLGQIEEFMLDLDAGRVAYAVLSFGGFMGLGDKLFAIPWEMMQFDTDRERIILDITRERLENAPGFDKNNWPSTANDDWLNKIYSYYGVEPYHTPAR